MFIQKRGNISAHKITSYMSQVETNDWIAKNVLQAIIIGIPILKKI